MNDYSWIKPGVRAQVIESFDHNLLRPVPSMQITIASEPYLDFLYGRPIQVVDAEDDNYAYDVEVLRPIDDDDKDSDIDWNEIANNRRYYTLFEAEDLIETKEKESA